MKLVLAMLILSISLMASGVEESGVDVSASSVKKIKNLPKGMLPKWKTKKEREHKLTTFNQEYSVAPTGTLTLPAEFAKMQGVIIQPDMYDTASTTYYKNLTKALYDAEVIPYLIVSNSAEKTKVISRILTPMGLAETDVEFLTFPYDAMWTRDYGPWHTYLNNERVIVDMKYYEDRQNDDAIPIKLGAYWDEDVYKTALSTEGGNFMSDGLGSCWVSKGVLWYNSLSQTKIENIYKEYMGCKTVTFVEPIPDEGTTHVDMFSKVINQNTIMVGTSKAEYGATEEEIAHLNAVAEVYKNSPKPGGGQWNIIRIPMTFETYHDDYYNEDFRVYYTHTNSLVVNSHAIIPIYGRGTDEEALNIYREALPEYTVVGIDSNIFIELGGAIHCTTMQVPERTYSECGNGVIDSTESCEDNYFNGKTCANLGFVSGDLKCVGCQFNYDNCVLPEAPLSDNQTGVCAGTHKVFSYDTLEWVEPDYTTVVNYSATDICSDTLDNNCDGVVDENCSKKDDSSSGCSFSSNSNSTIAFILFAILSSLFVFRRKLKN
ncbi:agmatine deiminase family protein [bacterium]|nr:agmatine deiminase family protein [bacterium]